MTPPEPPLKKDAETWRDIPANLRVPCSLRGIEGFGDFIPFYTNGVIAIVVRCHDFLEGEVHFDNIVWPEKVREERKPRAVAQRTRKAKSVYTLDDLLP